MNPKPRLSWLDGVRAVLAIWVVLEHSLNWQGALDGSLLARLLLQGHAAVTAFIVVSGFSLMYTVTSNGDQLRGGVKGFFWRRTRRILPPYWAALLLAIAVCLWARDLRNGWRMDLWPHALLLHDWLGWTYAFNPAFWSVAVEEHIYWLFPLILEAWRRFGWARCSAVLTGLGALAQSCAHIAGMAPVALHYVGPFAFGAAAAWVWAHAGRPLGRRVYAAGAVGALCLATGALRDQAGLWNIPLDIAWGAAVAAGLYGMATLPTSRAARLLSLRPIAWAGGWSYSLYLVHYPVIEALHHLAPAAHGLATGLLFAAVAITVSWAWSLIFERPFLSGRRDPKFADGTGSVLQAFPFGRATALIATLFVGAAISRFVRVDLAWLYLLPIVGTVGCALAAYLRIDRASCLASVVMLWAIGAGAIWPEYGQSATIAGLACAGLIAGVSRSWTPVLVAVTVSVAPLITLVPALALAGPQVTGRISLSAGRTEPVDDHMVSASV